MLNILGAIIVAALVAPTPFLSIHLPPVPTVVADEPPSTPTGLAVAADHSVWVTMHASGSVIHVIGGRPRIVVASRENAPLELVALQDGRVFYNQFAASETGAISEPVPTVGCVSSAGPCAGLTFPSPFGRIDDLAVNSAGDVAAYDASAGAYGRRTASGVRIYASPVGYGPRAIAASDDGAFWFALEPTSSSARPSSLLIRIDRRGRISKRFAPAGEAVEDLATYGSGVVYSAWVAPGNTLIRRVSASSVGHLTLGAPRMIRGSGGDLVMHRDDIWFVPNDTTGILRRLGPNGAVRTVEPPALGAQEIVKLAADGNTLWCITVEGWLYAFSFAKIDSALN